MTTTSSPLIASASFQALHRHHAKHRSAPLRQLFADDPERFRKMTLDAAGLLLDFSKNRIDATALSLLAELARECNVEARRDAMFAGDKINLTEQRAVLHTALRAPRGQALIVDGQDIDADVQAFLRHKAHTTAPRNFFSPARQCACRALA